MPSPASLVHESASPGSPRSLQSVIVDSALVRAVPLNVCLSHFGRHFRVERDVDNYHLSKEADHIDNFFSHDWATSRVDKFLTLIWAFNAPAAVVATGIVSSVCGVVRIYLGSYGTGLNHWWTILIGYGTFVLFLFFWQSLSALFRPASSAFLDVLCISQQDHLLKRKGILSLSGVVSRSKRLNILWSPHWSSRLWCVFELASFLKDSRNGVAKPVELMPVRMATVLLLQCTCIFLATVAHVITVEVGSPTVSTNDTDAWVTFKMAWLGIVFLALMMFWPSFLYIGLGIMRDLTDLPEKLRSFDVKEVKCFCCSNDHRHPRTGEKLPCDRVLVLGMLQRWFDDVEDGESYLESFNRLVRELSGSLGGLSAPVSQAVWAASAMTLPWLIDFIPWWATSELTGWQWLAWFFRGFMLWSYAGFMYFTAMRVCVWQWSIAIRFMDRMSKLLLTMIQAATLLIISITYYLPFRWVYTFSEDTSLFPLIPYLLGLALTCCVAQSGRSPRRPAEHASQAENVNVETLNMDTNAVHMPVDEQAKADC